MIPIAKRDQIKIKIPSIELPHLVKEPLTNTLLPPCGHTNLVGIKIVSPPPAPLLLVSPLPPPPPNIFPLATELPVNSFSPKNN